MFTHDPHPAGDPIGELLLTVKTPEELAILAEWHEEDLNRAAEMLRQAEADTEAQIQAAADRAKIAEWVQGAAISRQAAKHATTVYVLGGVVASAEELGGLMQHGPIFDRPTSGGGRVL